MPRQYIIDPQIHGDVTVGTEGDDTRMLLGHIAETGPARKLHLGGSKELVTLIVGKRGSGKSHTLGAILEGLATTSDENTIARHRRRRAVLLLDPMGNFWTTAYKVRGDGSAKVKKLWASLDGWNCKVEDVNVDVWIPAGYTQPTDPPGIKEFRVRVSDLEVTDLADLTGVNLMKDAQGAALSEAFLAITQEGWDDGTRRHEPKREYTFTDLIAYLEDLRDRHNGGDHSANTLRALLRSLRNLERQPVFTGEGTPLTELLKPGKLSVLMVSLRVGTDLRHVISRLLIRRILRERYEASQIQQQLEVGDPDPVQRAKLEDALRSCIPRSVVALDEAQELLGEDAGEAREALEDFCLLGRNYGLSLILATQRPTAAAISSKVRSQVDLCLIHRLLTQEDIDISWSNLLGMYPDEVMDGSRSLDFGALVRSLEPGQVIVSASHARAKDNEAVSRVFVARVRPRITVHGGEVE